MTAVDVQKQVAKARALVSPEVRPLASPTVPGVTVYRVVAKGDDPIWTGAVVEGGKLYTELDQARSVVARAWGLGTGTSVPPASVAQVMVVLLDSEEEPKLVTDPSRAEYVRRLGVPGVDVPVAGTTDGVPSVTFWYQTGSNPAQEVTVLFRPTSSELRLGRSHGGG